MTGASGLSTVACVAITKNEEHNLPDCLQSVHWVDEVAVIDAESGDRTGDLARGGDGAKEGNRRDARKLALLAFKMRPSWKTFNRSATAWGMIMPWLQGSPMTTFS